MSRSSVADMGQSLEYPFTPEDLGVIANMVHAHAGICIDETKGMMVYSRLSKRVRDRGLRSFADYIELIRHDAAERGQTIEALTTNHTKFFREIHHFEHFEQEVRADLVRRIESRERVRIWSSAASSGEEIYSLAMCLLGTDKAAARRIAQGDVALLATDLSQQILNTAQAGSYSRSLHSDIPSHYASAWTQRGGEGFTIDPAVRAMVRFRKLNLLDAWPFSGQFDVIFCRNVMIYFDEPTKELLLKRLAERLRPAGILYIGHSERLVGPAIAEFDSLGQTIYRRRGA